MFFYLALLFPVGMLLALLMMERLEHPLDDELLRLDLAAFLDAARPEEAEAFVSAGFAPALERYWRHRRHLAPR